MKKFRSLFSFESGFVSLILNSVILRVISAFIGLIATILISRSLGAEEAGIYFLCYSIVFFISSIARVGLDNTVLKYTGIFKSDSNLSGVKTIVFKAIIITSIPGTLLSTILFFYSIEISVGVFDNPALIEPLRTFSFAILFLALSNLCSISLQATKNINNSVFILNISNNLIIIFSLLFFDNLSLLDISKIFLISTFFTFLYSVAVRFYSLAKFNLTYIDNSLILSSCLPLWIVMMMNQSVQWSGQIISGMYLTGAEVAILATSQRLSMITSFVLMAVNMVVAPKFASLYKNKEHNKLAKLSKISVRLMLALAFPLFITVMIAPDYLMSLFGSDFHTGGRILQILCVGQLINVMSGSVGYLLSMSGHEKDLRNTTLITGPFSIICAFILTPLFGLEGAAIAVALSIATQNLISSYWVHKRLQINTLRFW